MEKTKKKRIKKYISWVCIASLVVLLAAMPLMAGSGQDLLGPKASILTGTVKNGNITTALMGGGTLSCENPMEVTIPEGVKITEFLVSNGDLVKEGDPLALIDRASVMSAITKVQEAMDTLVQEMAALPAPQATTQLTAKAGGLIKQVFAEKGDNVQDVMMEHGALAVLSLDGMMAVRITQDTTYATGDSVTVRFEDGTEIPGRVKTNMDGVLVITVEDDGYEVGLPVTVIGQDDALIGTGELEVHNAWRAVAYSGTVEYVYAASEKNTYAGQNLFTIKSDGTNPQLEALAIQHREYEALMLKLFQLYQAELFSAPCDGLISGVDENSIHLLAGTNEGLTFDLLANAPGDDADASYDNHVGKLEMVLGDIWIVKLNSQAQDITDYKEEMDSLDLSTESMTIRTMMAPVTVYQLVDAEWEVTEAKAGDILVFAMNDAGFVWAVYAGSDASSDTEEPTLPEGWEDIELPEGWEDMDWSDIQLPDGFLGSQIPTIGGSLDGLLGNYAGMFPQEEPDLYSLEEAVLMNVIPQNEMTLNIQLDQRDISKVQVGMQAEVTVGALRGEVFPAVITKVGDTGLNLGGSSRFTVELTLPIQTNMLEGMTATASIPLSSAQDIPVIPLDALVEDGSKTIVYTGYDEKNKQLINPVTVTLGVSDGIYAQILSGLEAGDTFWYSYYDILEIDHSVENPVFGFG